MHVSVIGTWFTTSSGQDPPPSAGLVMTGMRVWVPPPHDVLHSPSGLYSHSQSTAVGMINVLNPQRSYCRLSMHKSAHGDPIVVGLANELH